MNWASFSAGSNRGIQYNNDNTNPNPSNPPTANVSPTGSIAQVQFLAGAIPECFAPQATALVQPDCINGQFFIDVNLTSMGDAATVDIGSDYAGNPGGTAGVSAIGHTILGPFASMGTVNVTVTHNGNSICDLVLNPITYDCADYGKNSLSFDGVNDRVSLGNPASLAITGNKITLEAWINPSSWRTESWRGNIINTEGNGSSGYMLRCGASGTLSFNLGDGSAWHEVLSAANALTLNTWQHVAGTYDGTTMRLYLNGVQIGTTASTFNIASPGNSVVIGDWSNGDNQRNFPGKIDEVRVWNKTISAASLLSHLNTAYCGDEVGLVGYYKFDQGVANGNNAGVTTLFDLTANANNGTLSGFALTGATSNWVAGQTNMGACVPVTCQTPLGLTANVAVNTVNLSWTNNGAASYLYEVRTSGAPGSGAAGLTATATVTSGTPAFNVGGLSSSTTYTVYVRANCGGTNGNSEWSNGVAFTTGAACGDGFTDTGGASANYGNNENYVKTYCRTTPGDQVRVLFSSFNTEANWDKLFIFNGANTSAPKFASTLGAGFGNTSYGAGGWSGDLTSALPGPFTSSNANGCLTFAFVSDGSGVNPGWTAITSCVTPNNTCANSTPVLCGNTYTGVTTGVPHSMPANACPYNGAASTGGQNWWQYTATASEAVTFSTCGTSDFDTRISVFTGADCSNLSCVAMNDDSPGCASASSTVTFNAVTGTSYWIAVHGAGSAEGSYQLSVSCAAICAPPANDACASAEAISNTLMDGTGTPATRTNVCSTMDAPTSCSGAMPVQGVWFTFNAGASSHARVTLLDNSQDLQYTASTVDYALYTGACAAMGASNSVDCVTDAAGASLLEVTPNTDYRMLVYNTGGAGVSGTFGLLVEHPGLNDAAITAITNPLTGMLCGSTMAPTVTLLNNGDNALTSVQITYGLSGGVLHVYNWTGNLPYGASTSVALPTVSAEAGNGLTLTISTSLPNGAADEITANDSQSVLLDVGGEGVVVNIRTDANGDQITWTMYDESFAVVASGGPYVGQNNVMVSESHCLSTDNGSCFSFLLTDSYGDGLCCANGNGYWELRAPNGTLLLRDLFDSQVDGGNSPTFSPLTPSYGFGHPICLPAGSARVAANECGVFTNGLGNKVYSSSVPGASQYQFEFSDPDAGFVRRITSTHNYVHFGDMVNPGLTPGVKYFTRIRTNVDGPLASAHFGPGCQTGLSVPVVVRCSQLISAPAYGHSCNETRAFGTTSSFIYAQPVTGADQYQFHIFIPGESYDTVITRSSYILQLKWNGNMPLVDGSTYTVEINVRVNGLYSGFCPSTCTITIANPVGGRPEGSLAQASFGEATLWPNPVRDGQVNLGISGIQDAEQNITVDIQDIYGKQVFAKEFGNSGERFTTILDLPSDIASGIYMVNITVNGETSVQRLSIIK